MNKNKKEVVVGIIIIAVVLISIVGTYAYFLASVGETVNEKLLVKAGTMQLLFRDTDELVTNTEATLNFGDSITKEFEIENTGTLPAYAKISWDNLINTYLEQSLTYTLEYKLKNTEEEWKKLETESENIPRNETASKRVLADRIEIPSGVTYEYRLTITLEDLPDIDQTQDLGATLSTKFTLDEGNKPITSESVLEKLNLSIKDGIPNFRQVATTNETADGLYKMEDDYGMSYYFRGAANNNYVHFANFYWRIIRINGDGSLRVIFDGDQAYENANGGTGLGGEKRFTHINIPYNNYIDDNKYLGYMFGGEEGQASISKEQSQLNETDSNIKKNIDEWYETNIENKGFGKYLGDEIFCNDRSMSETPREWWLGEGQTNRGFGKTPTAYAGLGRYLMPDINDTWKLDPIPKFTCSQKNDRFTVSDTLNGNGSLKYPIGLITIDEIAAAGGAGLIENRYYYLYKNSSYWFWVMTPARLYNTAAIAYNFYMNADGSFGGPNRVNYNAAVAPVINIAPKYVVKMQGIGSVDNPYRLVN